VDDVLENSSLVLRLPGIGEQPIPRRPPLRFAFGHPSLLSLETFPASILASLGVFNYVDFSQRGRQPHLDGAGGGVGTVGDSELGVDVLRVELGRADAELEFTGDLGVRIT